MREMLARHTTSSIPLLGKAIPYGVYDVARSGVGSTSASVTIPPNSPSSPFVAGGIAWAVTRTEATELLLTADGGGSNGYRTRLWKLKLQKFADDSGLRLTIAHYPPGTSKWNKIEHRHVFSYHREPARPPPENLETVVNLIAEHNHLQGVAHQGRTRLPTLRRRYPTTTSLPSTSSPTPSMVIGTTPSVLSYLHPFSN